MNTILNVVLPVSIVTGIYLLIQWLTKANLNKKEGLVIKLRILLGSIFIGFLFAWALKDNNWQHIAGVIFLSAILLSGINQLHKRYFGFKENEG